MQMFVRAVVVSALAVLRKRNLASCAGHDGSERGQELYTDRTSTALERRKVLHSITAQRLPSSWQPRRGKSQALARRHQPAAEASGKSRPFR